MSTRITIDIFSGRPNPEIIIAGREEAELLERMTPAPRGARPLDRRPRRAPRLPSATLGYRGLIVERLPEGGGRKRTRRDRRAKAARGMPAKFRVAAGFVYGPRGGVPTRDAFVEDFVCGSTGPFRPRGVDKSFFDRCPEEIQRFRFMVESWPWKKWPWPIKDRCRCAPLWEPEWWNDGGQIQWNNNCYNYGTNYRTDTYAQPGNANGAMYTHISCAEVKAGAIADALIDAPGANNKCPNEGHLVALVVGPNWDFHWYRKGRNGYWTHKPGGTAATQLDNSGHLISDPRTADRGNYTNFCTFMVVMHGHVKIK